MLIIDVHPPVPSALSAFCDPPSPQRRRGPTDEAAAAGCFSQADAQLRRVVRSAPPPIKCGCDWVQAYLGKTRTCTMNMQQNMRQAQAM